MAAEYNKKTVADLQDILKSRSLSHNGKKADLVARLIKDDEDKAKVDPAAAPTTSTTNPAKADAADDVIDWEDDAAVEEQPAATEPTSETGAAAIAAGGQGNVSNPVAVPNQQLGENPATTDDLKVESEGAGPSEKAEKPETETETATAEGGGAEEKPATNFAKGLPVTEMEEELKKRKARAEKFGIVEDSQTGVSEAEKQLERAKRFGTGAESESAGVRRLDEALPEGRLRKRNRNDDHGGRGGKRRNFGGGRNNNNINNNNNRNRRRGNGNRDNGQPALSEKDSLALEARKKRFATAA